MLRALRARVNAALAEVPVRRKPALRRSDAPDALLATDLPHAAEAEAVAAFVARMTAEGWRIRTAENGWLLLDADVPLPEAAPAEEDVPGECGCCLSILARHAEEDGPAAEWLRTIIRAAEAGEKPFERCCGQLHAYLAELLRLHQPLPGILLPYLKRAYHDLHQDRRNTP